MIFRFYIFITFTSLIFASCKTQFWAKENTEEFSAEESTSHQKIMFYNCENYFDTRNDSLTDDDDFTPEGAYHWTNFKFREKANKIAKVIIALGEEKPPLIVGLCEIENRYVLEYLINNTPIKKFNYGIIHKDSPDKRGIDVALIYCKDLVTPLDMDFICVKNEDDTNFRTRDILYFQFVMNQSDTINFFVNHFPSRLGGEINTENLRCLAANHLRNYVNKLQKTYKQPNIVICGDFNDYPDNRSLNKILNASILPSEIQLDSLYNLAAISQKKNICGTHKFESTWGLLDQFIVSASLLKKHGLRTNLNGFHIFDAPFLLETDEKFLGQKTKRTHNGMIYNGGFSDHLPVFLELFQD